ncbi:hypothetical protein [Candidatus Nitrotoga fabula]|uniref:hypothetical protein n=1 Tax=Candidatus Nitrotoga fabula TaxID=2182327 RepID=UPI001BB480E7|nr:hypothetical protein [Candidatus Nitrotoga fabula]
MWSGEAEDDDKWYSVMHLQCMPGAGGFSGAHPVGFVLCLVHGYVEAALDEKPAYLMLPGTVMNIEPVHLLPNAPAPLIRSALGAGARLDGRVCCTLRSH